MKRVIIASDFHLKFKEEKDDIIRKKKVIEFIESLIGNTELLVLNGDIFDLWFSWNEVIIRGYFSFLCQLRLLRKSGCKIVFIAGNHDFWFNGFLEKEIGMSIFSDSFEAIIQDKKVLINHGDLYTTNDFRYKLFRLLIRNNFIKNVFKNIHPDWSLKLGVLLSRTSRSRKNKPKINRLKGNGLERYAKSQLGNFDIVIMGHSHKPKIVEFENGIYANSGDWVVHNSYIELIDGEAKLCYYKVGNE